MISRFSAVSKYEHGSVEHVEHVEVSKSYRNRKVYLYNLQIIEFSPK